MKFLDDNVNIEDLEQDEWTLSNPKHSKNENLRVLGIYGRQGTTKLIVCVSAKLVNKIWNFLEVQPL